MSLQDSYSKADQQRALALRYALNIVDVFALEIGNPDILGEWEYLKKLLLEIYTPEKTDYLEAYTDGNVKQKSGIVFFTEISKKPMAKSSRGRSQDRSKVAGGQEHEVNYEKEKTGASQEQIKSAIKSEGNQRKKVEKKLKKPNGGK
jgi:hypothetical protein